MLRLAVLTLGLLVISDAAFAATTHHPATGRHFAGPGKRLLPVAPPANEPAKPKAVGGGNDGQPGGNAGAKLYPIPSGSYDPNDPYNTNRGGDQTGGTE
jgi:hypothetical protein